MCVVGYPIHPDASINAHTPISIPISWDFESFSENRNTPARVESIITEPLKSGKNTTPGNVPVNVTLNLLYKQAHAPQATQNLIADFGTCGFESFESRKEVTRNMSDAVSEDIMSISSTFDEQEDFCWSLNIIPVAALHTKNPPHQYFQVLVNLPPFGATMRKSESISKNTPIHCKSEASSFKTNTPNPVEISREEHPIKDVSDTGPFARACILQSRNAADTSP